MQGIRLGGFTLDRLLGRGGMADVWLGRHDPSGQPAAIKVIGRRYAAAPRFRESFRREVRAVAGLDHPGIISVLDAGVAPADGPPALAGSPWLAMRVAEHGELRRLPTPMGWPLLREVLLQILDALAHAHARDVIHRDLKPDNVLLAVEHGRLRLMLTDFGIAHLIEPDAPRGQPSGISAGTPQYMAPEQLRGEWRDFGPWTDLYALGCVAFELATGAPPYTGRSPLDIATRHLSGPLPRLPRGGGLPPGLGDWIARLMARDPRQRPAAAADAAHALLTLPTPAPATARAAIAEALAGLGAGAGAATLVDGWSATAAGATTGTLSGLGAPEAARRPTLAPAERMPRPPIPETWYAELPRRPLLKGVGLGLFGVRALPFVGRDRARNTLWDALRRVEARGRAELVLVRGPEGIGKTALARWFTRRAREVGAADGPWFHFSPSAGRGDGVAAGLIAWFRGQGLDQHALRDRIRDALCACDPERRELIEAVVTPSLTRALVGCVDHIVPSPTERHGAERDMLRIAARPRPLIVVYDDLHRCEDTTAFVDWLLGQRLDAPVLLVATWRDDVRPDDPRRRAMVDRIEAAATVIDLGPLDEAAHASMIEDLLGLSHAASRALRARTRGNPLFAVQAVSTWLETGALTATADGYGPRDDAALELPETLAELAVDRLHRVVGDDPAARLALEVAATLGEQIYDAEWRAACAAVGVDPPDALVGALHDAGLTVPADDGWLFAHGFVPRAIAARAADPRRLHAACAAAVCAGRTPDERRARHLVEAGALADAVDALDRAAGRAMDGSEYALALALCGRRRALLDRLDLPEHDIRRARTLPVEIAALRFSGHLDEAITLSDALDRFPIDPRHGDLLAERARVRGARAAFFGDARGHFDGYQEAVALYHRVGDERGQARALHGLGWSRIIYGRYADAVPVMAQSRAAAERGGFRVDIGWGWHGEAAARLYGELPGVEAPLAEAERIFGAIDLPTGVGLVRADRADLCRLAGHFDESRRHAEAAAEIFAASGSHLVFRAWLALALVALRTGDRATADRLADHIVSGGVLHRAASQHGYTAWLLAAWTALEVGDDARFEDHLARVEADPVRGMLHPSLRRGLLEMGPALEARRPDLARRVWRLAADYHRPVDPALADRCAARMAALGA